MTVTPAYSSYVRCKRPEDKVKTWVLFSVVCVGLTIITEVEDHRIFRITLVHTDLRADDFVHFPDLWHQTRLANVTCAWSWRLCGINTGIVSNILEESAASSFMVQNWQCELHRRQTKKSSWRRFFLLRNLNLHHPQERFTAVRYCNPIRAALRGGQAGSCPGRQPIRDFKTSLVCWKLWCKGTQVSTRERISLKKCKKFGHAP